MALALALLALPAYAQLSIGEPALQDSITIEVGRGSSLVTHAVAGSEGPVQLDLVAGQRSQLEASSAGRALEHASVSGTDSIVVFSERDFEVSYRIEGSPYLRDGLWTWEFFYPESTAFLFEDGVGMVFVNGTPVDLPEGVAGINCHGCQMVLEYFEDRGARAAQVTWEGRSFEVGISSNDSIESLMFDQPSKSLGFEASKAGAYTVLVIPKELLWPPYRAYLDGEPILDQENISDDTHVWLVLKPESAGTVTVIGTTVVPEFSALALPLAAGLGAAAAARLIRR